MALATQTIHDLRKKGWDFGLKDYPIWNEEYRDTLNAKLLNEYEFEEIGQETPDMFTFYLNRAMAKIMPYYVQLYQTTTLQLDILNQYNFKEEEDNNYTDTKEIKDNIDKQTSNDIHSQSTANVTSSGTDTSITSRPPQSQINIGNIKSGVYARDGSFGESESTNDTTDTSTTTNAGTEIQDNTRNDKGTGFEHKGRTKTGRDKPVAELIQQARETLINIDREIIENEEISKLFYMWYI
nr:MAG TPA: Lower collar protein [Caudoviricetes sp.]